MKVNDSLINNYVKEKNNKESVDFYKLYSMYKKMNLKSEEVDFKDLENEIYSLEGNVLSEKAKIALNCSEIIKYIKANNKLLSEEDVVEAKRLINQIRVALSGKNEPSSEVLKYMKRMIVKIEIRLGMSVSFYNDAYDTFVEEYNNIFKDSEYEESPEKCKKK